MKHIILFPTHNSIWFSVSISGMSLSSISDFNSSFFWKVSSISESIWLFKSSILWNCFFFCLVFNFSAILVIFLKSSLTIGIKSRLTSFISTFSANLMVLLSWYESLNPFDPTAYSFLKHIILFPTDNSIWFSVSIPGMSLLSISDFNSSFFCKVSSISGSIWLFESSILWNCFFFCLVFNFLAILVTFFKSSLTIGFKSTLASFILTFSTDLVISLSWYDFIWFHKIDFEFFSAPHSLHSYFTPSWTFLKCVDKLLLWVKIILQFEHLCPLFSWIFEIWVIKLLLWLNSFLQ